MIDDYGDVTLSPPQDERERFLRMLRIRLYNALGYLTLFAYIAVVTIGALAADLLILRAIELTVSPAVYKYALVAAAFDWFQIGSAFLIMIAASTHAYFSARTLMRLEARAAADM